MTEMGDMDMVKQTVKRGEGTMCEKRPGYYEYRFYYIDVDNKKKRKSFGGYDQDELYMRADEFLRDIEDMRRGVDKLATIPQILRRRYELDYKTGYIQEPTYYRSIASLKRIEESLIGRKPIAKITLLEIQDFLGTLRTYSNSVIRKIYSQLVLAYSEAIIADIVTKNPMLSRQIRYPKSAIPDKRIPALTIEEQKALVETLAKHKRQGTRNEYSKQILIELYTGMRMGEINALRPEDIDFKKGVIHIRGTVSMGVGNRMYRRGHTKTDAGMRDIPMNNLVRPILEQAIAEMKWNKEGVIFYDYNKNSVITTTQVNSFYRRICKKADIEFHGQHSLRHTFATRCIEAGVKPVVLKNWLGHTNIHITLDTYADVYGSLNSASIETLEKYLGV